MISMNIKKPTQLKGLTNAGPKQKTKTSSQLPILFKFTVDKTDKISIWLYDIESIL